MTEMMLIAVIMFCSSSKVGSPEKIRACVKESDQCYGRHLQRELIDYDGKHRLEWATELQEETNRSSRLIGCLK